MSGILTTKRITHLVSAGRVTQHRAPCPATHSGRLPWLPGHSYPVRSSGRSAQCRVVVERIRHQRLGDLAPRDLHDMGHRTRLDLAQWWLRTQIARQAHTGEEWDDHEVLRRFERHADRMAWRIDFRLDTSHQPRLLHADPAQGYTHLPQHAAVGEPEAVSAYEIERQVEPARARHTVLRGYEEQRAVDELSTLESRLARIRTRSEFGVDVRGELRIIERQIARAEGKIARATA